MSQKGVSKTERKASNVDTSGDKCPQCNKDVSDSDKGLQCEICEDWHHIKCQSVTELEYKFLNEHKTVHWYCATCNKSIASVIKVVSSLKQRQDKIQEQVETLENNVAKQAAVVDQIKSELIGLHQDMKTLQEAQKPGEPHPLWSDLVSKQVESKFEKVSVGMNSFQQILDEAKKKQDLEKERDVRSHNIIIYRVPEMDSDDERRKADKAFCLELCNEVLEQDVEETDFKSIFRIGKKTQGNRPLMLQLREKSVKDKIMDSLYKLKDADDKFKNISVTHDFSKEERAQCKLLLEEAKQNERDDSGDFLYRVRGSPGQLKIVKFRKR